MSNRPLQGAPHLCRKARLNRGQHHNYLHIIVAQFFQLWTLTDIQSWWADTWLSVKSHYMGGGNIVFWICIAGSHGLDHFLCRSRYRSQFHKVPNYLFITVTVYAAHSRILNLILQAFALQWTYFSKSSQLGQFYLAQPQHHNLPHI